jgi:hypothetical protein
MAPCGLGTVEVSDVEALNTLRGDIVNVYSSSSYELSVFSSKADSAHGGGERLTQGRSLGTNISDHLLEAIATVEEFRSEGCLAVGSCRGVESSSSYHPSTNKNKGRKGKGDVREGTPHNAPSFAKGRCPDHKSAKAKANKVLLDSEAGTSSDFPPKFLKIILGRALLPFDWHEG